LEGKDMKALFMDGTPAEIEEMIRGLGLGASALASPRTVGAGPPLAEELIEERLIERFLKRIPLAETQKSALEVIVQANGDWVLSSTIAKKIGYSRAQFSGLMGALGRRWGNTPGWTEELDFGDVEWDAKERQKCYRARPSLLTVWKRLFKS
jgi:hypothetical protein